MSLPKTRLALLTLTLVFASLARGQEAAVDLRSGSVAEAVERLQPGQYLWVPEIAPAGPVLLIVNRNSQRAILYRNGVPVAVTTVSTGKRGHETPTGVFTILQKRVEHYSSIYDNAPMPYMQRLTWGGVALHGGHLPGYPASHGCIRLPHPFAKLLYGATALGMTVIITDSPALPRLAPADNPLASAAAGERKTALQAQWHPESSPSGPVSIIISSADEQVVVLRNGREIGRAPITLAAPIQTTSAMVLATSDKRSGWYSVALTPATSRTAVPLEFWNGFGVDPSFRRALADIVTPGTTVVLTGDSLASGAAPSDRLLEGQ